MNINDNDIANLYKLEFERSLRGCNIYCGYIPQYNCLSFVHCELEILYAIQLCFKDNGITTFFKDTDWCKGLTIPMDALPAIPPFTDIKKHFLKCFLDRLTILEEMFEKEKCDYTDLLLIKNKLLRKLDIVYIDTQSLRLKYESKRYTCFVKES